MMNRGAAPAVILAAAALPAAARGSVAYVTNLPDGTVSRLPDGGGTPTAFAVGLPAPSGLAFGPTGTLYVDSETTGAIYTISPAGTATPIANVGFNPTGLVADASGNLYVSLQSGSAVDKVTPAGTVTSLAAGLGEPEGLAVDRSGLLVANFTGNEVDRVTAAGVVTPFASVPGPYGVTTDAAGNVYVGSFTGGYVEAFSAAGTDLGRYATVGGASGTFGLAFDAAGDLLVASNAGSLYAVAPGTRTVTTYATGLDPRFIAIAPVPEPTAAGVITAAAGLAGLGRRRPRGRPVAGRLAGSGVPPVEGEI